MKESHLEAGPQTAEFDAVVPPNPGPYYPITENGFNQSYSYPNHYHGCCHCHCPCRGYNPFGPTYRQYWGSNITNGTDATTHLPIVDPNKFYCKHSDEINPTTIQ